MTRTDSVEAVKEMIQNEIQSIDALTERTVFKELMEGVFLNLYETNLQMYEALERRVQDELGYDQSRYRVKTGVIERAYYDESHHFLSPIEEADLEDKHYDRKYQDMHDRLDNLYDKISEYEDSIADITARIEAVYGNQITGKQIYDILVHFEMMYYKMTDLEKKEFMKDFINSIELYPEKMYNGSIVKQINFKFGVYYEGEETMDIRLLNEKTVETVCLLSKRKVCQQPSA